jgi:hypothetical protein
MTHSDLILLDLIIPMLLGGSATVHMVSCWPLTVEAWVRAWVSPCEIFGGQSGTGTGFSLSSLDFPCQYHFTGAPYSYYHLGDKQ